MLRCLIIDDEPLAQQVIERYIDQVPALRLVGKCASAPAALKVLGGDAVDLIFLDIRLPLISGVDLLRSLEHPPLVVFTTAYPEFAVESYELKAVDYLLKPITFERFQKCVEKVLALPTTSARSDLFLKVEGRLIRLVLNDIVYIESLKDYLRVVTTLETHLTHMTMKSLEAQLPASAFVRVHRSFIVSVKRITALDIEEVDLGVKRIPVGESYRKKIGALKKLL